MIRKPIILIMLVLGLAFAPQTADAATQWEIQQAQEMLNTLGYDAGSADGFMGARTRNAIRAFESDMGLSMTGTVDQVLLDELDREVGGSAGSGVDSVDYAVWLEDLVGEAERTRAADRWVVNELYLITDDLYAVRPGDDFSYQIESLENVVYDAKISNDAAIWVIDELYVLIDDYYAALTPVAVWSWPNQVLATDFRNASNLHDAGVLLDAGNFYIDRYVGLVSQPASTNTDDGDLNGEELALAILGALLEDNTTNNNSSNDGTGMLAQGHITAFATNAFAMDLVISAEKATQPFVIGLFESNLDTPGYRIAFEPGRGGEVAIILCTGNNNLRMVANGWSNVNLADGNPHYIQWTRDWSGDMELYIDDELVIWANDTYMNGWFEGVLVQSHGGDWALESLYIADDN
jgi:peptidoglycan hydrolase-like protein with peptidoglycan-binding domain